MTRTRMEKVATLAEIISAVAVVVSLVYVGYEVRQNTSAVASSSYQAIHDAEDEFWQSVSTDPGLSQAWEAGLAGGTSAVEPAQLPQFTINVRRLIYLFQNVHYQRRKGVVDDELWEAWRASLDEFLVMPGFKEILDVTRPHLSVAFVELVEGRGLAPLSAPGGDGG